MFFEPREYGAGADPHIGFFWGENSSDNKFWSSTNHVTATYAGTNPGNQISDLVAKYPSCYVYVFPTQKTSYGKLRIHKWSSNTTLTNGNSNYSLNGAQFTIYRDSACRNAVQTLTIGSDSYSAVSKDLLPGTYWIKEVKAPDKGYQISTKVYSVNVTANNTSSSPAWVDVYEAPKTTKILLTKSSTDPEVSNGNSNYNLAGAVYRIYTDKNCTKWTGKSITTDEKGNGSIEGLALNEYWLKEYSAPNHYTLDKTVYYVDGRDQWGVNAIAVNLNVKERPVYDINFSSKIAIQKVDSETGKPVAAGNGSLQGAEFKVKYYSDAMTTDPAASGRQALYTWILKTDEKGEVYQAACDSKDDGWVWRHAGYPGIYDDLWSFESDAGIKR